jgi:hypothetical protein
VTGPAGAGAVNVTDPTERQNDAAENSHTAIPMPGPQSKLRKLLTKLKVRT